MDENKVLKIVTPIDFEPMSYVLTMHKIRMEAYYKDNNTSFQEQFDKYLNQECLCHHMTNLIHTYGVDCIKYFLDTFFIKKAG